MIDVDEIAKRMGILDRIEEIDKNMTMSFIKTFSEKIREIISSQELTSQEKMNTIQDTIYELLNELWIIEEDIETIGYPESIDNSIILSIHTTTGEEKNAYGISLSHSSNPELAARGVCNIVNTQLQQIKMILEQKKEEGLTQEDCKKAIEKIQMIIERVWANGKLGTRERMEEYNRALKEAGMSKNLKGNIQTGIPKESDKGASQTPEESEVTPGQDQPTDLVKNDTIVVEEEKVGNTPIVEEIYTFPDNEQEEKERKQLVTQPSERKNGIFDKMRQMVQQLWKKIVGKENDEEKVGEKSIVEEGEETPIEEFPEIKKEDLAEIETQFLNMKQIETHYFQSPDGREIWITPLAGIKYKEGKEEEYMYQYRIDTKKGEETKSYEVLGNIFMQALMQQNKTRWKSEYSDYVLQYLLSDKNLLDSVQRQDGYMGEVGSVVRGGALAIKRKRIERAVCMKYEQGKDSIEEEQEKKLNYEEKEILTEEIIMRQHEYEKKKRVTVQHGIEQFMIDEIAQIQYRTESGEQGSFCKYDITKIVNGIVAKYEINGYINLDRLSRYNDREEGTNEWNYGQLICNNLLADGRLQQAARTEHHYAGSVETEVEVGEKPKIGCNIIELSACKTYARKMKTMNSREIEKGETNKEKTGGDLSVG